MKKIIIIALFAIHGAQCNHFIHSARLLRTKLQHLVKKNFNPDLPLESFEEAYKKERKNVIQLFVVTTILAGGICIKNI